MALVEAGRKEASCSLNQPDDMGFPACHIGQKKFYWASVLSTFKALPANTAGKAFSLGIVMFSSLADGVARSSSTSDEMTANDPK